MVRKKFILFLLCVYSFYVIIVRYVLYLYLLIEVFLYVIVYVFFDI